MPSASGVYSLPLGYLAVTGTTIQASQHNPPLEDIAAALTGRLSRDGTAPMTGALQLASGTVTAPGGVFAADASSGFYKTTAGIGVAIGGTKVAEFTAAGLASGARLLGELIPYALTSVPSALWVFPVGQTLSRTTYPTLWAQVQLEITAGNTFFNNGDGSTTFGIGDMRGRAFAAIDNMGGTDAGRLVAGSLTTVRTTIGGAGGVPVHTLAASEIPSITSNAANNITVTINGGPQLVTYAGIFAGNLGAGGGAGGFNTPSNLGLVQSISGSNNISVTSNNTGGGAHDNMQPTMLGNYIMFAGD